MTVAMRAALLVGAFVASAPAAAQVVFYEHDGYEGRSFMAEQSVANFERFGFNDRASSILVMRERWEVCEKPGFAGPCAVLRPGRYPSLSALGLNDRVSSARLMRRDARVEDTRYAPPAEPVYDNYRRPNEKLFEAKVTSVRAILGYPERRCWVERGQVSQDGAVNVPGAMVGAVLGGIIGHQVDEERARAYEDDVRRCADGQSQNGRPDHFDVTYEFRGRQHRVQTTFSPGPTLTVNAQGEPRV